LFHHLPVTSPVCECVQDQFVANEMEAGLEEEEEEMSVVAVQFAAAVCALDLDITVVQAAVTFSLALSGGHLSSPGGCSSQWLHQMLMCPLVSLAQ